jgi:hypothetical protein
MKKSKPHFSGILTLTAVLMIGCNSPQSPANSQSPSSAVPAKVNNSVINSKASSPSSALDSPLEGISISKINELHLPNIFKVQDLMAFSKTGKELHAVVGGDCERQTAQLTFDDGGNILSNTAQSSNPSAFTPTLILQNGDRLYVGTEIPLPLSGDAVVVDKKDSSVTHKLVVPESVGLTDGFSTHAVQTSDGTIVLSGNGWANSGKLYFFNADYSFRLVADGGYTIYTNQDISGLVALADGGILEATDLSITITNADGTSRFKDSGQTIKRISFSDGDGSDIVAPSPFLQLSDGTIAIGMKGSDGAQPNSPESYYESMYFLSPSGKLQSAYTLKSNYGFPLVLNDKTVAIPDQNGTLHLISQTGQELGHYDSGLNQPKAKAELSLLNGELIAFNLGNQIELIGKDGKLMASLPMVSGRTYGNIVAVSDGEIAVSYTEGTDTSDSSCGIAVNAIGFEFWRIAASAV